MALRYKIDIMAELKKNGYTSTRIREEKLIGQSYLQQIRHNELVSWKTIDTLCRLLNCQVGDLVEYVAENTPESAEQPFRTFQKENRESCGSSPLKRTEGQQLADRGLGFRDFSEKISFFDYTGAKLPRRVIFILKSGCEGLSSRKGLNKRKKAASRLRDRRFEVM